MGDPGFGVLAGLITDYRSERVALALNVGTRIRTEEVSFVGRDFGHELTYGLGLDVAAIIGRIDLGFEIFGRTPLPCAPGLRVPREQGDLGVAPRAAWLR